MGDVQGKRKGDPAIERDRGIQTREDQLGVLNLSWCRSYLHVLSFLWVFGSISTSLLLKMTSLRNCFLLNCHMEKLIGERIIIQKPKKSLHVVCWKKGLPKITVDFVPMKTKFITLFRDLQRGFAGDFLAFC
ncbi:uncharacterized protein LOC133705700 isoform X3 [Populus nigra]|uniref:uncharacterized protein LOC133705700 isoform X3 n=1 Tax=Populus nigra TaxID=3691 RepID=UPI002B274EBC|nr:uncharacterized protein LOC133705700 isoform X3 [Populus nigra]